MKRTKVLLAFGFSLLLSYSANAQHFVESSGALITYRYSNGVTAGITQHFYLQNTGSPGSVEVSATKSATYTGSVTAGETVDIALLYDTGSQTLYSPESGTDCQIEISSSQGNQAFTNVIPTVYTPSRIFIPDPFSPIGGTWIDNSSWTKVILDTCTSITITAWNPTAVVDPGSQSLPKALLLQNYPNPFNPSTTIRYSLPKEEHVSVRVFNTLGQEVAVLVNQQQTPGFHQVRWNADVAGGIYFYRLSAGEFVKTKKMILLQ